MATGATVRTVRVPLEEYGQERSAARFERQHITATVLAGIGLQCLRNPLGGRGASGSLGGLSLLQ